MVEASLVNLAELLVLVVGVVIALQQLNDIKKTRESELETRQAALLMGIYDHYLKPEHIDAYNELNHRQWEDYDDFVRRYIDTGKNTNFVQVGRFLTGIGVLMRKGLIDTSLLNSLLWPPISRIWEKYEPIVKGRRIALGYNLWQEVEYAYHELEKFREQHPELRT